MCCSWVQFRKVLTIKLHPFKDFLWVRSALAVKLLSQVGKTTEIFLIAELAPKVS